MSGGAEFQAEDGIRDHCVTGVQTCALPISVLLLGGAAVTARAPASSSTAASAGRRCRLMAQRRASRDRRGSPRPPETPLEAAPLRARASARSEERRVGEGGRCRVARNFKQKTAYEITV